MATQTKKRAKKYAVKVNDDGRFLLRDTMRRVMDENYERVGDRAFICDMVFARTPDKEMATCYRYLLNLLYRNMVVNRRLARRKQDPRANVAGHRDEDDSNVADESTAKPQSARAAITDPDGVIRFHVYPHEDGRPGIDIRECSMFEVELLRENALRRRTAADAELQRWDRLLTAMREHETDTAGELPESVLLDIMMDPVTE